MGLMDIMKVSASGMKAQRTRMEVISSNLANIQTTRTDEGGPYRKKQVVFTVADIDGARGSGATSSEKVEGVKVEEVIESAKPFEKIYDPGHPDADNDGYVTFPNVNLMEEMADMVAATRAYEANVNAVNATKEMVMKSLEIGR